MEEAAIALGWRDKEETVTGAAGATEKIRPLLGTLTKGGMRDGGTNREGERWGGGEEQWRRGRHAERKKYPGSSPHLPFGLHWLNLVGSQKARGPGKCHLQGPPRKQRVSSAYAWHRQELNRHGEGVKFRAINMARAKVLRC